tara:strand:- start:522 stop:764 length:243 start_codon:yes stop_codon:yes gene_type:complete
MLRAKCANKKKKKKMKLTLDFWVNLWFNIRMLNVIDALNDKIENVVEKMITACEWLENKLISFGERLEAGFDRLVNKAIK